MKEDEIRILLKSIDDLIDQATKEKSHYYTRSTLVKASVTIVNLWEEYLLLQQIRAILK